MHINGKAVKQVIINCCLSLDTFHAECFSDLILVLAIIVLILVFVIVQYDARDKFLSGGVGG